MWPTNRSAIAMGNVTISLFEALAFLKHNAAPSEKEHRNGISTIIHPLPSHFSVERLVTENIIFSEIYELPWVSRQGRYCCWRGSVELRSIVEWSWRKNLSMLAVGSASTYASVEFDAFLIYFVALLSALESTTDKHEARFLMHEKGSFCSTFHNDFSLPFRKAHKLCLRRAARWENLKNDF